MKRVVTALLLAPFITWVVIWAPFAVFGAVLAAIAGLCFWEFGAIAAGHGIRIPAIAGIALGTILLFTPYAWASGVLFAIGALLFGLSAADLRESLPSAAVFLLGMLYVYGSWHSAVELRAMSPFWLFLALSLNWIGDSAAMYVGRAIGRHKLAPRVSPAKSWEGSVASIAASVLFGLVYARFALPSEPLLKVAAIVAIGNVAGQLGDLCESAFKRGAGMKDSGTLLPGHGGWLDRVDSSLFSVPAVYTILRLLA